MKNNDIITMVVKKFQNLLSHDTVDNIAHNTGLIKRSSSKLCPSALLIVMIVEMSFVGSCSLSTTCSLMCYYGSMLITPQALSQRLDQIQCVQFLRSIFYMCFQSKIFKMSAKVRHEEILGRFNNVLIEDSSICSVSEKLSSFWKGTGGVGPNAAFKLHMIWNVTQNSVTSLNVTSSSVSDLTNGMDIIKYTQARDLVLRDLGYFHLAVFRKIDDVGAYWLSRFKSSVNVFTVDGRKIDDLGRYVEKQLLNSNVGDFEVRLGTVEQLKARLIVGRVPKRVYDERIRKLRRKYQKNSRTLSEKRKRLERFTFLITNMDSDKLSVVEAFALYKMRWQVELLFKAFKSKLHLNIIKSSSRNRVECFILAKLIAIVLTTDIFSHFCLYAEPCLKRELSFSRFLNWALSCRFLIILFISNESEYPLTRLRRGNINSFYKQNRSRKTTLQLLQTAITISDIYPQETNIQARECLA